jgi:formiminotetrahydrofolate cyclodeaminase
MELKNLNCVEFCDALDSKEPVPGGGGASALAGALGAALAGMVCSLTVGKKKYADVEPRINEIWEKASSVKARLVAAIDKDAECFEPLAKAYGMAKDDPERDRVMESALRTACSAPLEIMRLAAETVGLLEELREKGSTLAVSDVGVGASMAKAALTGASLNIFINTKLMKDREYAEALNSEAAELMNKYAPMAEKIFDSVLDKLR